MSSEAEYVSTAVGFSPVTPGNSMITGVTAAAGSEGASPMGFIDALLGMLSQGVALPTGKPANSDANAKAETNSGNIATLGLAVDAAIKRELPAAPVQSPEDGEKLLADLVAALTAIDDSTKAGEPIDPALHKKLSETLDDIAGLLGITLPAPPAIDPVLTAAAAGPVVPPSSAIDNTDLDIGKGTLTTPVLATGDGDASPDDLVAQFVRAVKQAASPEQAEADADSPETTATKPGAAAAETETIDPASPLGKLVAKLAEIADRLAPAAPDLSAKLEAVVQKLVAGPVDQDVVTKLEANLDSGGLDALLAHRPEGRPAAPTPSQFTAPTLATPDIVALPPKQSTPAPKATEPAVPSGPELAEPGEVKIAKDTQPADMPQPEPQARDRGSFAAHLSDVRGEKLADQANQSQQPQIPTSQVKADLGVAATKAVFQAPVQQINVPQVAFEVVRQFNQGASRFQIRLDPPELGRIDVRMQVDGDGNVHARMTVERAETLDLMQRDQRSLEKALAQAGLDSSKTNLEFSLRQNPFGRDGQGQQHGRDGSPFASRGDLGTSQDVPEVPITTQYRGMASASGVNLFV